MSKRYLFIAATAALMLAACQESLEDRGAKEAETYTRKNCPAPIDKTMILDSMTFEKDSHTFCYYYRMTGAADTEGAIDWDKAKDALRHALKNTTAMKMYKDAGYSFRYVYRSEKDPTKVWKDVTLTKNDY